MKKVLSLVAVLALISTVSFGQVKFGAKAGVNFANIKFSTSGIGVSADSKTGLVIGGFAKFELSEKFAFQPEVLYAGYGSKMGDEKMSLNYISVPLMAKYYFGGFNLQAGPQLGLLMSAKAEDEDVKDAYKGMDFGLSFGLGYDLDMGLGFDARYYMGMSDINDMETEAGEGEISFGDIKTKNKGFQLTVSYAF